MFKKLINQIKYKFIDLFIILLMKNYLNWWCNKWSSLAENKI